MPSCPTFPAEELATRLENVRLAMAMRGLDCLGDVEDACDEPDALPTGRWAVHGPPPAPGRGLDEAYFRELAAKAAAQDEADANRCRCGRERAPGRRQCERCLSRDRTRTRSRLAGGKYAAALDRRLREAKAKGRGLSLSAGDVSRLLRGR